MQAEALSTELNKLGLDHHFLMRKSSSVIRKKCNIANIFGINSSSSYKQNCIGFFRD